MAIFTLDLLAPTPNLNGNTEQSLLEQLKHLMATLRDVRDAISGCSDHWHGRNFLPQGSEEARIIRIVAENAWRLRMEVIDTMHEEFLALALEIQGKSVRTKAATEGMKESLDAGIPIVHPAGTVLPAPPAEIVPEGWTEIEAGFEVTMPDSNEAEDERINKLLAKGDGNEA